MFKLQKGAYEGVFRNSQPFATPFFSITPQNHHFLTLFCTFLCSHECSNFTWGFINVQNQAKTDAVGDFRERWSEIWVGVDKHTLPHIPMLRPFID